LFHLFPKFNFQRYRFLKWIGTDLITKVGLTFLAIIGLLCISLHNSRQNEDINSIKLRITDEWLSDLGNYEFKN